MADKKISQLTELTSANAATDILAIVDIAADETKKITLSNLRSSIGVVSANTTTEGLVELATEAEVLAVSDVDAVVRAKHMRIKVETANGNAVSIGDLGGNARGSGSVTIQASRSLATQVASGTNSVAIGNNANASANSAIALGNSASASGENSISLGESSIASSDYSVAIGAEASAWGGNATASGSYATASGDYSTASGNGANASANNAIALGSNATASGNYATA